MAQHDGAVQNKVANATALPVMNITATDTSLFNVNANVVLISQLGHVAVLKSDLFDFLQYKGGIL